MAVSMNICVYVFVSIFIYVYVAISIYLCLHISMWLYICIHVSMWQVRISLSRRCNNLIIFDKLIYLLRFHSANWNRNIIDLISDTITFTQSFYKKKNNPSLVFNLILLDMNMLLFSMVSGMSDESIFAALNLISAWWKYFSNSVALRLFRYHSSDEIFRTPHMVSLNNRKYCITKYQI